MPIFRSRADALIEQQLQSAGLHPGWWPGAKAAIFHCEQGDWFEPVMTEDGVFAARDLVARLGLEPFVRGGVDWNAHRNPFLADPASRYFYDERLESTFAEWERLYDAERNPTLADPDLNRSLVYLRDLTREHPDGGEPLSEDALDAVWSLGSAGYCWRVAEEHLHGATHEEYTADIDSMWRTFPDDPPRESVSRDRLLFWGACTGANLVQSHDLRPWAGSPGGFAVQFDYFEDAFARACDGIVPTDVEIARADLWYAWCFGFVLRDSERWLSAGEPNA